MKRCEFQMTPGDHKEMVRFVKTSGTSFSEFIRQAMIEKLARDKAIHRLETASNQLSDLIQNFRTEIGRTRNDLKDDNKTAVQLMREDIGKSMKKNEELNKTFVLMLGGQVAPASPQAPQRPRGPARDEDAPMQIPG